MRRHRDVARFNSGAVDAMGVQVFHENAAPASYVENFFRSEGPQVLRDNRVASQVPVGMFHPGRIILGELLLYVMAGSTIRLKCSHPGNSPEWTIAETAR